MATAQNPMMWIMVSEKPQRDHLVRPLFLASRCLREHSPRDRASKMQVDFLSRPRLSL